MINNYDVARIAANGVTERFDGYSATVPQEPVCRLDPPTSGSATSRGDNDVHEEREALNDWQS